MYLLATSNLPDPYVNVLVHAVERHRPEKVVFVEIVEISESEEGAGDHVRYVYSSVEKMLRELAGGAYVSRSQARRVSVSIPGSGAERYEKCLSYLSRIETGVVAVPWVDLDRRIGEFMSSGVAMFDLTTLKKNLLVDVASILLSRGCMEFYTFELTIGRRYFDQRDLIHNLGATDYNYRRVSNSRHIDVARRRMVARSGSFQKFLAVTALVGCVVLVVQFVFPDTWLDRIVIAMATAASIAGMVLFPLMKDE